MKNSKDIINEFNKKCLDNWTESIYGSPIDKWSEKNGNKICIGIGENPFSVVEYENGRPNNSGLHFNDLTDCFQDWSVKEFGFIF